MSSGNCGNCDCADKSQCTKGNQYGFENVAPEMSYVDAMGAENDGNCKCSGCNCSNCTCGCNCH